MDAMAVLAKVILGVVQGSVLSPLLFVMYVLAQSDIVQQHNVSMHNCADDTQLCVAFDNKDLARMSDTMKYLNYGGMPQQMK